MAGKLTIDDRNLVIIDDIEKPHATAKYPLGMSIEVQNKNNETSVPYVSTYEYHRAGAALQAYGTFAIKSSASGVIVGVATCSGTGSVWTRHIVPQTGVAAGSYFWGVTKGLCTAAHTAAAGVNMSAGRLFRLLGDATTLTPSTVSQATETAPATVRGVNHVACSLGLSATSANMSVYLFGDPNWLFDDVKPY